MKKFKILVTYEVAGYVEVEAKSREEALDLAENDDAFGLPDEDACFVQGSYKVEICL